MKIEDNGEIISENGEVSEPSDSQNISSETFSFSPPSWEQEYEIYLREKWE